MSPLREAGLTAQREIRRNLASTKGIAMFVLFFLGGVLVNVGSLILQQLVEQRAKVPITYEMKQDAFRQGLEAVFDPATAQHLSHCPPLLFALLFQPTLVFAPLVILLIGFDQMAGDVQHRSIRYIVGRSRRESIVAGKALGVWGVISVMTLVLHLTVWVAMLIQGSTPAGAIFAWGPRLWFFSVAASASYVGLCALVSSFFKTPIVALFVGAAVFFTVWLTNLVLGRFESTRAVTWAFPFSYEGLVESPEPARVLGGIAAYLAWGALMVAAATFVVKRRDV